MTFRLGEEEFGVDIIQVQEIIRIPKITSVPQVPEHIKGIINLRGRIIAAMDLARRFGMQTKDADEDSRIIILEVGQSIIGMIVDSVSEVIRISSANVELAPEIIKSEIRADYIKGVGKIGERMLILPNLERIITEEGTSLS